MQKPLSEMASYIKNIIPSKIPKDYAIKQIFLNIADETSIRSGVIDFRNFLYSVCDRLIADGHLFDKSNPQKKEAHGVSLATCYPFINHVKNVLFNIGFHGKFTENNTSLTLDDAKQLTFTMGMYGGQQNTKISAPKVKETLIFLTSCGFFGEGLKFSYPDKPDMLIGLKVMANAQRMFAVKGNNEAFLRCDYRILAEEKIDAVIPLKEYIRYLPKKIKDFVLNLHYNSIKNGLTCQIDAFFLIIRFIYYYKNKEIWSFSMSVDSGHRILIKAQNINLYNDTVKTFPLCLQEKIAKGYGCEKKRFGKPCQKGCHGFSFALDDSILNISDNIELWIEKELSCSQKK